MTQRALRSAVFVLALPGLLAASPSVSSDGGDGRNLIRAYPDRIELPAVVNRAKFERELLGFSTPGYHFLVWNDGGAAGAALFLSRVSDLAILSALERLGLRPGNALGMESWNDRNDASSKASDKLIEGPGVEVLVRLPGAKKPLGIGDLLTDPGGRGFDMRFGGHEGNIHLSHSGCLICLYSCPGSKIGNRAYTVRDYAKKTTEFRVREGVLPPDGTEVTIVLRRVPPRS
ncbi:MAG TPA: YdjY domain-containing protein [Thermoanaerobaculia bacterium]|nr:YdjY domain-containing protein [Thermoanaerobaculia bacterium]